MGNLKDVIKCVYLFDDDQHSYLSEVFGSKYTSDPRSKKFHCVAFSSTKYYMTPELTKDASWISYVDILNGGCSIYMTLVACVLHLILPIEVTFVIITEDDKNRAIELAIKETYPERPIQIWAPIKAEKSTVARNELTVTRSELVKSQDLPFPINDTVSQSRLTFYKLLYNNYLKFNLYDVSYDALCKNMTDNNISLGDIMQLIKESQHNGTINVLQKGNIFWIKINVEKLCALNNQLRLSN